MIDVNWQGLVAFETPENLSLEDIAKSNEMISFLKSPQIQEYFNRKMSQMMRKIIIGNTVDVDSPILFGGAVIAGKSTSIQKQKEIIENMYSSLKESIVDDLPPAPKIWEQKNKREMKRKGWK